MFNFLYIKNQFIRYEDFIIVEMVFNIVFFYIFVFENIFKKLQKDFLYLFYLKILYINIIFYLWFIIVLQENYFFKLLEIWVGI